MQHTDVIIIGAGIVGAACAQALAQTGLSVRVIDARLGGATAAGMGHLVVMDDSAAELARTTTVLREAQADWRAEVARRRTLQDRVDALERMRQPRPPARTP